MAGVIGGIFEFLIGFLLLPRLITFVWMFLVPIIGLSAQQAIYVNLGITLVLLVVIFFFRKILAAGFFLGIILDFIFVLLQINLF